MTHGNAIMAGSRLLLHTRFSLAVKTKAANIAIAILDANRQFEFIWLVIAYYMQIK